MPDVTIVFWRDIPAQVIVGKGREILYEATLPLGVARMHGELEPHEIHTKEDLRRLRHRIREILSPHLEAIQAHAPVACVAVVIIIVIVVMVVVGCFGIVRSGTDGEQREEHEHGQRR